ncbi:MAG: MFS transporter [Anaerolineales bacterium]|nr:MFS transporter [Anaerolineales bacterium]
MTTTRETTVGYIALLRTNPNFRWIWLGQVVSLFGDWFNLIASAALIAQLTRSGLAVGGLFVVRMLAPFLISPAAGVATDRFNRKALLILADLARGVIVLGFLLVRQPQHTPLLYALTALQLAISGVFFPARNAILPEIVCRRELGAANALSSVTWSVMLALGAAMGGLVAGEWGIYPAFIVDTLSFFLSAVLIWQVAYRAPAAHIATRPGLSAALRDYLDGLRFLGQRRDILAIALHKAAIALTISGVFQVVQVRLAQTAFPLGEGGGTSLGLLYAATGVGTGLGPLLARCLTGDRESRLRAALGVSYLISALGLVISAPMTSLPLVLLGSLVRSSGGGMNWVFSSQLLLVLTPNAMRGRTFSSEFALFTLANAAGAAAGGWLLDNTALSLTAMMAWMAAFTLLPWLLWSLWEKSGMKNQPASWSEYG